MCIKTMDVPQVGANQEEQLLRQKREVAVLATLALHPNIIRCVGCLTYSPEVCHGLGACARAVLLCVVPPMAAHALCLCRACRGILPSWYGVHYRSVSCRYHECFADGDKGQRSLQLVMEWADGGDLESVIQRHAKARTYMSEDQILGYFVQLISALSHVHAVRLCFGGGVSVCCSTNVSCNEQ